MNIQKNFFLYLPPLRSDCSSAFHGGYCDGDGEAILQSIGCSKRMNLKLKGHCVVLEKKFKLKMLIFKI